MSPSWVELVGRNAAAETVRLSGTLVVTETPDETVRYDFHHAPGGRWRVERSGEAIYVAGPARTVARMDDEMRVLDDRIRIVMLGTQFTPLDLLGAGNDPRRHRRCHRRRDPRVRRPQDTVRARGPHRLIAVGRLPLRVGGACR